MRKLHPTHKTRNTIGLKPGGANNCIGKYLAIPKEMWSALYLASYILPRRCFFQNFNSIQIFGDFLLNATNPSSSIFAMNNSPACIFNLSCTIQRKIFAKRTTNLHLVQLNEALPFRTRPLLQQLLYTGALHWTLPTVFTVDSCEGFFWGVPFKKRNGLLGPTVD